MATDLHSTARQKRAWSTDRLLYELSLPNVDLDAVAEHAKSMLSRTFMEGFVHGNADADMARACLEQLSRALASFPLPDSEREVQEIVKLNSGLLFADAHTNPEDLNHALELYYQVPRQRLAFSLARSLSLTCVFVRAHTRTRCRGRDSAKMSRPRCSGR